MLFPLFRRKVICDASCHVAGGRGVACDYEAEIGTPIYSPFYGTIYHFQETEGGNWLGIQREDGYRFEFAHLSQYIAPIGSKIEPGQEIALSGNTGTVTTGPHVHHQILDPNGVRIDPEEFYTPTNIPTVILNGDSSFLEEAQKELLEYSAGMLTCSWDIIDYPLSVGIGLLTQQEAYQLADRFNAPKYLPYRYLYMFYKGNISSTFDASYYYPKLNNCVTTIPTTSSPRSMVFEFSHQLQFFYNENRGSNPPIEIVDSNYPSDDLIRSKLRSVLPYTDILLKHE